MRFGSGLWLALLLLTMIAPASLRAAEPIQTFFVIVPDEGGGIAREVFEICADRFAAALTNTGRFRAQQDVETQRSVSACLDSTTSASSNRECKISMANVQVDYLIPMTARQIGGEWSWSLKALEPQTGAAQVWGGDELRAESDPARAAYGACDTLARQFACSQGVATACSGASIGSGPILVDSGGNKPIAPVSAEAVSVSALDVIRPVPSVVSVWIDGREVGTSSRQITGISPGNHEVTLKATGYQPHAETLAFEAGRPTKLRNVELVSTTGTLLVTLDEPGSARVSVDGREVGTTGEPIAGIEPGRHTVVLEAQGYESSTSELAFEAGKQTERHGIRMTALPATLELTTSVMGAEVRIDGQVAAQSQGPGALQRLKISAGEHVLTVAAEDYLETSRSLALTPGGTLRLDLVLERNDSASSAPAVPATRYRAPPSSGENCFNGIDDDGDGATDCADALCAEVVGCASEPEVDEERIVLRAHGGLVSLLDFVEDVDASPSYGDFSGSMALFGGSIGLLDTGEGLEQRLDFQQMSASVADIETTSGFACGGGNPCSKFDEVSAQSLTYLAVAHDDEFLTLGAGAGLFGHTVGATDYAMGYSFVFLMELMPLDADWAKAGVAIRVDLSPSSGGNLFTLLSLQWSGGLDL